MSYINTFLLSLKEEDYETVRFVGTFKDDNIICIKFMILDKAITYWWGGEEGYASIKYCKDSKEARKYLKSIIEKEIECEFEDETCLKFSE